MTYSLEETIPMMNSNDYKARFKAEYWQTRIRYEKLHTMIVRREAGKLSFEPTCPIELWRDQAKAMGEYLHQLEIRAMVEDITLNKEVDRREANQSER